MKTLSIQQPWATLLAAGIKDVENRTWETQYRGKLLIHASGKKVPTNFLNMIPLECANSIENAITMGIIPELQDMPRGAVVGCVDLSDCTQETNSIWDDGPGFVKFVMKNACLFETPISDIKGKLGIYELPLNEVDLPFVCQPTPRNVQVNGDEIIIPLSTTAYDILLKDEEHLLDLYETEELNQLLLSEDENSTEMKQEFATIRFELSDGTNVRHQCLQNNTINFEDEDGEAMQQITVCGNLGFVMAYEFTVGDLI